MHEVEALEGAADELLAFVAVSTLPGNALEFSQPIQMRFDELLAGVRGDVAIKVVGDEFAPMVEAADQIAALARATPGAVDVKVEHTCGLPFLDVKIDRAEAARFGLTVSAVQDVIGAAIGRRPAGFIFEGDRRYAVVLRLSEDVGAISTSSATCTSRCRTSRPGGARRAFF